MWMVVIEGFEDSTEMRPYMTRESRPPTYDEVSGYIHELVRDLRSRFPDMVVRMEEDSR